MVLNFEKTEIFLEGTKQKLNENMDNFSICVNDVSVKKVNTHNLLGVQIDSDMSWNAHVTKLCSKLRSRLYLFNKIKHLLPLKARQKYYSGLVQPIIYYGCVV